MLKKNALILIGIILLLLIVAASVFTLYRRSTAPQITSVEPKTLVEGTDSILTIHGVNLKSGKNFSVTLNDSWLNLRGEMTDDSVAIVVNTRKLRDSNQLRSNLIVKDDDKILFKDVIVFIPDKEVSVRAFNPTNIQSHPLIRINGKNLDVSGITVRIDGILCSIQFRDRNYLLVATPTIPDGRPDIPLAVFLGANQIFAGKASTMFFKRPDFTDKIRDLQTRKTLNKYIKP